MNKLIPNNHYIKILLSNYLRDQQTSPQKLQKIEQLINSTKIDRLNITNIYHIIEKYDDKLLLSSNIKIIDTKLISDFNIDKRNTLKFSLTMNV